MTVCALIVSSCASPLMPTPINMAVAEIPKPERTQEIPTPQVIPTATYIPSAGVIEVGIWVPPYLAEVMGGALQNPLRGLFVGDETMANIRLEVGEEHVISQWVYALVTPFPSTLQGVTGDDLLSRWQGGSMSTLDDPPLLMDQNTHEMFNALWGPAEGPSVQVMAKDELLEYAWAQVERPTLAIIPFEDLEPRWKVLAVDGLSPIRKDFNLENYRLNVPISLNSSDPELVAPLRILVLRVRHQHEHVAQGPVDMAAEGRAELQHGDAGDRLHAAQPFLRHHADLGTKIAAHGCGSLRRSMPSKPPMLTRWRRSGPV